MAIAIISLSSRGSKKQQLIKQFAERLSFAVQILKTSSIYETYDLQKTIEGSFLSCVLEIETDMSGDQLLEFILETKEQLSNEDEPRKLKEKTINSSLIDYRGEITRTPRLTLPHPETHKKAYIIIPLSEMEPDWQHPVLKKTANLLAQEVFWPGWGSFFASKETLLDF